MAKTRLNISLDEELVDFVKIFAAENRMSVTEIFKQYLSMLKCHAEKHVGKKVLPHSAFHKAMADVQRKLRDGTAVWHSYDEVFGE
jgi:hypothetical protein